MQRERFLATGELKFVGDPSAGQIAGYGSVFNVTDSYGDVLAPGAFDETLAEQRSSGRIIPMFGEHSFAFIGGDPYPIGGWTNVESDDKGLKVEGSLVGLGHPDVARVYELLKAKLIKGLSIAFSVRPNGAVKGTKAGEPKRLLKSVDLFSVDVVGEPANSLAQIDNVKAMLTLPNHAAAAQSLLAARDLCSTSMAGGDAPTVDERKQIAGHIGDAYRHILGEDMPPALKSKPDTIRQFEDWLQEAARTFGFKYSNSEARAIAEGRAFKSAPPRDEDTATLTALRDLRSTFSGFTLPKLGD